MKHISKIFVFSFILVILADQITKFLVRGSGIDYVKNYGAGFGILQNQTLFLIIVSVAILVLLIVYYKKIPKQTSYQLFTGLVLGGLIGNLIDRIFFGFVTDFIDFKVWPSFNIADTALSIGIIGLIIWILREK